MRLNFNYNTQFFSADLPPSMTLADLAAYIEAETNLPPTHQTLVHKYTHLSPSRSTTLEQSNIREDDTIVVVPFDPVADNLQRAYDENPEFFADVTMLYVKISLNGYEMPAFIDTGAQRSLITPELCKKCDLTHLVDTRFKMNAKGVGEKQSDGRIHSVPMMVNGESFATSLTVLAMDGMGLLIGLDWMKRFRVKIDLDKNGIFMGETFVEFLNEWEVRNLQAKNGILTHEQLSMLTTGSEPTKTTSAPEAAPAPAPALQAPSKPQGPVEALTPEKQQKINSLVEMGFDSSQSLQALQQCGWNVDMAAGLLF